MARRVSALILALCVAYAFIFCAARYGWRLFGFKYCENPAVLFVENLEISQPNAFVSINGYTAASASAFVGETHRLDGDILYVGLKYNILNGFFTRDGGFDFRIPIDPASVTKILLTGNGADKTIWEKSGPQSTLAFYLVSDYLSAEDSGDLESLTLEDTPVFTLDDIQRYYWDEQVFVMEKDLIRQRLNKQPDELPVPVQGLPYVVVVNGERIYSGKFWTLLSSAWPNSPCISVEGIEDGLHDLQPNQQLYAVSWDRSDDEAKRMVFDERIRCVLEHKK